MRYAANAPMVTALAAKSWRSPTLRFGDLQALHGVTKALICEPYNRLTTLPRPSVVIALLYII